MSKILINTGRSRRGPSRFSPALRCLQLSAFQDLYGYQTLDSVADRLPLIQGSAGHVGEAHFMRRAQAKQEGDAASRWYTPREAIKEWCAREIADSDDAAATERIMLRTHKLLRLKYPHAPGRVLGVETEVFGVVGERVEDTNPTARTFGLWAVHEASIDHLEATEGEPDAVRSYHNDAWILPTVNDAGRATWVSKRLDLVYKRRDGMVVDVDYKFLAHVSKTARLAYSLDLQFAVIRTLGAQIHGRRYGGCEVWCIEKAAKPEASAVKVEKSQLPPIDTDKRVPRLLLWVDNQIHANRDADPFEWPRAASEVACYTRYGRCPFWEACTEGPAAIIGVAP